MQMVDIKFTTVVACIGRHTTSIKGDKFLPVLSIETHHTHVQSWDERGGCNA